LRKLPDIAGEFGTDVGRFRDLEHKRLTYFNAPMTQFVRFLQQDVPDWGRERDVRAADRLLLGAAGGNREPPSQDERGSGGRDFVEIHDGEGRLFAVSTHVELGDGWTFGAGVEGFVRSDGNISGNATLRWVF